MADKEWSPRPARGYSWPPFEPGNLAAVRHGARSARLVSAEAEKVAAELAEVCPWISEVDAVAVDTFCRAAARYRMLDDYVAAKAEAEGVEAVPRTLWQEVSRAESNAMKAAEALGLDPTGRARLLRDLGWARSLSSRDSAIAALAERGAAIRAQRLKGGSQG